MRSRWRASGSSCSATATTSSCSGSAAPTTRRCVAEDRGAQPADAACRWWPPTTCASSRAADFESHEARVCIADGALLADPARAAPLHRGAVPAFARGDGGSCSPTFPRRWQNSVEIARRCSLPLKLGESRLPNYPAARGRHRRGTSSAPKPQQGFAAREQAFDAAQRARIDEYRERLERELDVIGKMGFAGYFLIVADFIRWARANGVPVGPGRGSGAGSLVAYSLGITDLDPLKYDLLFERFLNPERVSMPDFDIDFCMDGRDRVIEYVVAEVRPRARLADHHLRHHGREGRGARRGPRARHGLRLRRQDRQAHSVRARHHARRRAREGARAQAAVQGRRGDQEPHRPRALARRPDAQRRHARRRRGDRALEAHRVRAAVRRRQGRQRRHAVRQGRRRSRGPGEVRLPRPAHAHGHRPRGEDHQRAARDEAASRRSTSPRLPMDDAATYKLMQEAKHHRGVPARIPRHEGPDPAPEARPLRGHRRAGRAVPPGPAGVGHGRRLHRAQAQPQRSARARRSTTCIPRCSRCSRPPTASSCTRNR